MDEILLDSDVIIAWLRGYEPYDRLLPHLLEQGHSLAWTPVSVAEIFAGVRSAEAATVENLFLILDFVSLSPEAGKQAGRYMNAYSRSHGVELADALIAAAASTRGTPLWTLNRKRYPMRDVRFYAPPRL